MIKPLPGHSTSVPTLNISYPPSLVSPVCFVNSFRYRFGKWMEAKHSAWRWSLVSPWRRCRRQECFLRRKKLDWFKFSRISVPSGILFPRLEGGSYEKKRLIVCLPQVKRTLPSRKHTWRTFDVTRGNSMRLTRIRGPFTSKPIGRPGTNGNRARRNQAFLKYLDAGNTNPRSIHLETH